MEATYHRPTPDEIVARLNEWRRGRLRVYLGAAPGVGKTYAMLEDAHEQRRRGVDVVVGLVECHGRRDTEALLQGLEQVPPRVVVYHGVTLKELDVDAVLARNPELVLVDELAHTNAPGSPREKRYEDVAVLQDAGIHVWTTLNVQHLESVNDTVEGITGIKVRETVPDSVLQGAAEIRLIDLEPDALMDRLREGKVYPPDVAFRALRNFFQRGNLIALRDVALRVLAEVTDARLESYWNEHGLTGQRAMPERLLICLTAGVDAEQLVRTGYRASGRGRAPFHVLHVDEGRPLSAADARSLEAGLALAARLGARIERRRGRDPAQVIVEMARELRVTQVVLAQRWPRNLWERAAGTVVERVLRALPEVDVLAVRTRRS